METEAEKDLLEKINKFVNETRSGCTCFLAKERCHKLFKMDSNELRGWFLKREIQRGEYEKEMRKRMRLSSLDIGDQTLDYMKDVDQLEEVKNRVMENTKENEDVEKMLLREIDNDLQFIDKLTTFLEGRRTTLLQMKTEVVDKKNITLGIPYVDIDDGVTSVEYVIAASLIEAIRSSLLQEIELNVFNSGTDQRPCVYTSTEYKEKIKAVQEKKELVSVLDKHANIRKKFLGQIGEEYAECGYVFDCKKGIEMLGT